MSADHRTQCRRCPGRTRTGTPSPTTEPSLRERLRRPWTTRTTPKPASIREGPRVVGVRAAQAPGTRVAKRQHDRAGAALGEPRERPGPARRLRAEPGTNPVQIPADTTRHSTALRSINRHVSTPTRTSALDRHSSSTTADVRRVRPRLAARSPGWPPRRPVDLPGGLPRGRAASGRRDGAQRGVLVRPVTGQRDGNRDGNPSRRARSHPNGAGRLTSVTAAAP